MKKSGVGLNELVSQNTCCLPNKFLWHLGHVVGIRIVGGGLVVERGIRRHDR